MNSDNERSEQSFIPTGGDDLAARLVRRAARLSPADLSDRLEEEWLADLAQHSGAFTRLRFALGCTRATRLIVSDAIALEPSRIRAVAAPAAVATVPYSPLGPARRSNRTLALFAIVAVHVLLIYGFAHGLGVHIFQPPPDVFTGKTIVDVPPSEPPPPIAQPRIGTTIGPIDFPVQHPAFDPVVPEVPIASAATPITVTAPPSPMKTADALPVTRVTGGPGSGFPTTADYYPALSRNLGETGAATVEVCVDTHGRLTSAPTIRDSAGIARLDAGALALARAGTGHYRATTENGVPVASCYAYKVRFSLNR